MIHSSINVFLNILAIKTIAGQSKSCRVKDDTLYVVGLLSSVLIDFKDYLIKNNKIKF